MSQFTWWRRFYPTQKLAREQLFKGGSKLLQRIEFGEFEYDPLSAETELEEELFRLKCIEIDGFSNFHKDTLNEMKVTERIKKNKRVKMMMETHLKNEHNRMMSLCDDLMKEFNVSKELVDNVMSSFDGTTRELYFYIKAIAQDREIKSSEEILMFPRMQSQQPRHILKQKQKHHKNIWQKIVQNKQIW